MGATHSSLSQWSVNRFWVYRVQTLFGSTRYYWCNILSWCMSILYIFLSVNANNSSTTCIWAPVLQSQPLLSPAPSLELPHLPPSLQWVTAGPPLIFCQASTGPPPSRCRASSTRPPPDRWILATVPIPWTISCIQGLHVHVCAAVRWHFDSQTLHLLLMESTFMFLGIQNIDTVADGFPRAYTEGGLGRLKPSPKFWS